MEIDLEEEISLSAGSNSRASLCGSPMSPKLQQGKLRMEDSNDSDSSSSLKAELEEGEINSDVSSSNEQSLKKGNGKNSRTEKETHSQYSSDSDDTVERSSNHSSARRRKLTKKASHKEDDLRNIKSKELSISDEDDFQEVDMVSSSDEKKSDHDNDEDGKSEASEDEDTDRNDKESTAEESEEEKESRVKSKLKKQNDESLSDISSAGDSVHSERSSNRDSVRFKKDSKSKSKAVSDYDSNSDSDLEEDVRISQTDKTKSLSFKKIGSQDKGSSSRSASSSQKYSDHDSDVEIVDHLDIAAPQQALLRETKKKSFRDKTGNQRSSSKDSRQRDKERESSRQERDSRGKDKESRDKDRGSRDKDRDKKDRDLDRDRVRGRERDRKDDHKYKEKEARDKSKDYYDKKSGKYKERKHDEQKSVRESSDRPRSPVERKLQSSEEDLRRKLLQKRSTRDEHDTSRKDRDRSDVKEKSRRDEKGPTQQEKRKDEVKTKREEKASEGAAKKEGKSGKESADSKSLKGHKISKDKSPKESDVEKNKKRRREKAKSEKKKKRNTSEEDDDDSHSGADSSDDDKKDALKPATKRPRADNEVLQVTDEEKMEVEEDENDDDDDDKDKKDKKEYSYDDVSLPSSEELSPPPSPVELKKPTYYPAIMGCRDVKEFHWLNKIEEGTYGVVYRARDHRTDEIVALKRLKMEKEKEGFPITSLREISTLLKSQHPNIVTVREIVVGSNMDKIYIVMDYVEHDLKSLMETMTQPFLVGEVKTLMMQLLRGIQHMHDNWILHRDIKASNLLLSHKGILKIGDFGLAREYGSPLKHYTTIVVTLWYRAPELLLGGKEYATAIDMWSVGCVFAELLTMKPLFPGRSESDMINRIFKELGTPNDKIWPGPPAYSGYPLVKKMNFANHPYNVLRQKFGTSLTDKGFNLLNRLLTYDPDKRITAEASLEHEYFKESPMPVDPSMFPTWPAKSELGHKARKHMASPKAPEGGDAASKVANEDSNSGFHMPAAIKGGYSAKGAGFNLKF
eukprot:gene20551-22573_t